MIKVISRVVLISVLVASACSDDGPTAPPVPGSIGGLVTSTSHGRPLEQAAVIVEGKISWTGLDGMYLIEGVTPGNHELIATKWKHQDHVDTVTTTAGQLTTHDIVLTYSD
jgi:hypothetical protein